MPASPGGGICKAKQTHALAADVDAQYQTPAYTGKRALDFAPFTAAMQATPAETFQALDTRLSTADVAAMRRMLAAGELTSEQLVAYYLQRIQRHDVDRLNSVIALNPRALDVARELDARGQAGQGPMYGIPVLLKDIIATVDMPTTAGAKAMQDARTSRDAFLARRLREAGAIILGKTNLSEWSEFMTPVIGFSVLGGQTRNPYGRFDVGGSSSGSAVAAAARLAPVTVGAETSGSLIYPASQNSVFALKPSIGLLSRDLVIPLTSLTDAPGPMARTTADLATLMNTLKGVDPADPASPAAVSIADVDFTAGLDDSALRGLRVGVIHDNWLGPVPLSAGERREDDKLLDRALSDLKAAGANVKKVKLAADANAGFHVGTGLRLPPPTGRLPADYWSTDRLAAGAGGLQRAGSEQPGAALPARP